MLQCAHARSETVHNAHHYNLLSPWHKHTEVPNWRSYYSAVLSASYRVRTSKLISRSPQYKQFVVFRVHFRVHREAHPFPQQFWYGPGPGSRRFNQIGMSLSTCDAPCDEVRPGKAAGLDRWAYHEHMAVPQSLDYHRCLRDLA